MRIIFGIMSAVQPAPTVAALCDALGSTHPILIHHDFSQQRDFMVTRPGVSFVDQPVRTGWANWGFTQGTLKLMETALARPDWDYFQLLSPTCLPVRPMAELEAHLLASKADYFVDSLAIANEESLLMSHGWRAFAREGLLRHRILRRARRWYLGTEAKMMNRAGLSFPVETMLDAGGVKAMKARVGLAVTRLAQRGVGFDHIFSPAFPCYAGGTWFAASRRGVEYLLARSRDERLIAHFRDMHMADEMLYATVFRNSPLPGAAGLHFVSHFMQARPVWLGTGDLDTVQASGRFFARKFPEDPASEVRLAMAARVAQRTRAESRVAV